MAGMNPTLIALIIMILYWEMQRKNQPKVYYIKNLPKGYNGAAIPPFGIFIKESERNNQPLLSHELRHWTQYQEKGLFSYYTQYFKELKKYGYDRMPMEKDIRINETRYCKENYTECVRGGKANTVYNPMFRI